MLAGVSSSLARLLTRGRRACTSSLTCAALLVACSSEPANEPNDAALGSGAAGGGGGAGARDAAGGSAGTDATPVADAAAALPSGDASSHASADAIGSSSSDAAAPGAVEGGSPRDDAARPLNDAARPLSDAAPATVDGSSSSRDSGSDRAEASPGDASPAYDPCPPSGAPCVILPFGDSITDGFTVPGGYRIPLFRLARQDAKQFTFVGSSVNGPATVDGAPFPQRHEGHSGYTVEAEPQVARQGIAPLVPMVFPMFHPDITLLMIGTNDLDLQIDLATLPTRLGTLIDAITAVDAHTLVVVAQITPTTDDALNTRIQAYNGAMPALVKARADGGKHVVLVDMYRAFTQDPTYKTRFLADRLHPNAAGYEQMGNAWYAVLRPLLR